MTAAPQLSIDLLEQKVRMLEAENKMLKNREFNILRTLPEIVFMVDLNERFVFLNDVCREKFKLESNILDYNVNLKDILSPESLIHLKRLYIKEFDSNKFHAKELKGICKDGSSFPITVFFSKLYENEQLSGFIGVGFDLSERIDIESKLKEANLAKMKFLSIIAHDLRNPFNSLVGFSTLLLANFDKYSSEKVKEYISHMYNAATHGYQLLENLLDWARANMRKIDINPLNFYISHVIYDAISLLHGNASKKEIHIETTCPENLQVFADQNMIRTVIRNLLSNAIKFTPRKGKVRINAYERNDNAIIEVVDNGVGITPDQLPQLFSLSSESTTLGTEREKGTGLGLILCYEFITINKGTIEADSIPSLGSTFRITIPILRTIN